MSKRQPTRTRKVTATCIECDRPYDTTVRVGDPFPQGRCFLCAAAVMTAKREG
jgi:hypothetical protein